MSKHLERDLDNLQKDLLALAASVEEAIHKAIRALQDRDVALAEEVIDGDNDIDEEENHVEEECLKVLALHQPVAVDLRRVTSVVQINTDLERMADLAEDIAERAVALARWPAIPIPGDLQRMTDLASSMVRPCPKFCVTSSGNLRFPAGVDSSSTLAPGLASPTSW